MPNHIHTPMFRRSAGQKKCRSFQRTEARNCIGPMAHGVKLANVHNGLMCRVSQGLCPVAHRGHARYACIRHFTGVWGTR
jgi:hypothetical protein